MQWLHPCWTGPGPRSHLCQLCRPHQWQIFYSIAAVENLVIHGSDVSNAFGEAPPPKQGFFLRPDRAFRNWWNKSVRTPIPEGAVIPVEQTMQGHPEAPQLWEKHINEILCSLGLTPTKHEPCLYSGLVNGERLLFKRQVDDFATASASGRTSEILLDRLDDLLSIPIKRQGVVLMYNGLDVLQAREFIRISCETYIDKIFKERLVTQCRLNLNRQFSTWCGLTMSRLKMVVRKRDAHVMAPPVPDRSGFLITPMLTVSTTPVAIEELECR